MHLLHQPSLLSPPTGSEHRARWQIQQFQAGVTLRRRFLRAVAAAVTFVNVVAATPWLAVAAQASLSSQIFLQLDVAASRITCCCGSGFPNQSDVEASLSLTVAMDALRIRLETVIADPVAITKETCRDIGMGTLILC